jgi:carboxypeptidase C (cathepsin A)
MTSAAGFRLAWTVVVAGLIAAWPGPSSAQDAANEAAKSTASAPQSERRDNSAGILKLLPPDAITQHSIATPQGKIDYTATAGTLSFYDQSGNQSAAVYYTAYVAKNAGPNRPLTFAFNGGPGAASAYLHLGVVGPRILQLGPDGHDAARAELQDNPSTWLAFTDLVMIDPVGTGWSRAAKSEDAKNFWGVRSDADAMAKAISLYVGRNNRGASPKYLLGESYGGFRAVKTARALLREQGLAVSGLILVSPLLEGWLTFGDDTSALHAALHLPSLAAAELERKKAFTPEAQAAAEKFAMTDYLVTLAGKPPQGDAAKTFYGRVAAMTGVPEGTIASSRGFVNDFVKTIRAGKIVSRYDADFAVDDPNPERRAARGPDPILDGVSRAYGGGFADYARNELGFKTEMTYTLLAGNISGNWDWGNGGRFTATSDDDIRTLLAFSPSFRLMVVHGYADMVTPYGMSRYVLDHLPPIGPPDRVRFKLYRGGHMFYIAPEQRKAFSTDAAAFYRSAE